jgi:hypothetical protein
MNRIGRRTALRPCLRSWRWRSSGRCSDRCRFESITACQGCALARICPHCAALVQPSAKIQIPDLWVRRLAPTAGTLAPRFLVCSVQAYFSPSWSTAPPSGGLGGYRRDVPDQHRRLASDSSPHEAASSSLRLPHKTKAKRALHRMALAGTVPLLAKIPSPLNHGEAANSFHQPKKPAGLSRRASYAVTKSRGPWGLSAIATKIQSCG